MSSSGDAGGAAGEHRHRRGKAAAGLPEGRCVAQVHRGEADAGQRQQGDGAGGDRHCGEQRNGKILREVHQRIRKPEL